MSKRKIRKFTEEEKQFIFKNNYMKTAEEVADLFNRHFNEKITISQIKSFRSRYKLKSGLTGKFEKGHKPFNKGKKWNEYMSKEGQLNALKTTFKKGNVPHNRKKIFEERVNKNGYIEIKIQDGNKNKNWILKHRYIYEQIHGEIPEDHIVIFADGNKLNFQPNNLIAISKKENVILNKKGLRYDNVETTKLGITVANLIMKTNELKKEMIR